MAPAIIIARESYMISQIQAAVAAIVSTKTPVLGSVTEGAAKTVDEAAKASVDKTSFSTLAAQLNECAARAAKRDDGMTHAELGRYGRTRINEFLIEAREANSGTRAMEVPKTNDPELLDRAREASAFVTRTLAGDKNARNPFENLSREQLNLITFDDSGAFTLNERRAAWQGVQKMDDHWRSVAIGEGVMEQARTGKASRFYDATLNYLKSLPTIERAVSYPKDVESMVRARMQSDPTLPSLPGAFERAATNRKLTLYDILAGISNNAKDKKADSSTVVTAGKFTPRTSPAPTTAAQTFEKTSASPIDTQPCGAPSPSVRT
jgi:hypothetical protein